MTRPRVGFLGTGWIGRHRMEAMIATGAIEAAAICDPSPECVAAAREGAPDAQLVDTYDAMLDLGLDGVVIATPSALHAAQSIRALERGVAVFCQKPLGRSADEARSVVDAARAADRLLGVDLSYRKTAAMQAITGALQAGELGRVFAIDLVFHNGYGPGKPWFFDRAQSGGGCVIDLGVHLVDLALWSMGFPEVAEVRSTLFRKGLPLPAGSADVEDYAVATIQLADGPVVRLACSWELQAGREAVIEAAFYGTSGGAALRNVGGSFYDFTAERLLGTRSETLVSPPDEWGARAAADWAVRLAEEGGFDPAADEFVRVAEVLDRIYSDNG